MIRSKNTKPELKLKKILKIMGFSYQLDMYGKPDFVNKKEKIAVFIDGCFWHKCPIHYREPRSNREFWIRKIEENVKRDRRVNKRLKKDGYKVFRIWEHTLETNKSKILKKLTDIQKGTF